MPVTWRSTEHADALLNHLGKGRRQSMDGAVSYSGVAFGNEELLIERALEFSGSLALADRHGFVRRALFAPLRAGETFRDGLLRSVRSEVANHHRKPLKRFTFATELSLAPGVRLPSFKLGHVHISLPLSGHRTLRAERREILRDAPGVHGPLPSDYRLLTATATARTGNEAVALAHNAVDLLRSFWNFHLNRGSIYRWSAVPLTPMNALVLHPIHTLHGVLTKGGHDLYWYQFEYKQPNRPKTLTDSGNAALLRNTQRIRVLLARCKYSQWLEDAFLRYGRALDRPDMEEAFHRLWAVLELLTATPPGHGYESTIRRASAIWNNGRLARVTLESLRSIRNELVHRGAEVPLAEASVSRLKRFVEELLLFHLANRLQLDSAEHTGRFLDYLDKREGISAEAYLIKSAAQFYARGKSVSRGQ